VNDLTRVEDAEAEQARREPGHRGLLEALGAAVSNGVLVTDANGNHLYANAPMLGLLASHDPTSSVVPPSYVPSDQYRQFWRTISAITGGAVSTEASIEFARGELGRVLVLFTVVPWTVAEEPLAVWIAREAYEYESGSIVSPRPITVPIPVGSSHPFGGGATSIAPFDSVVHALTPREHEIMLRLLVGSRVDSIGRRLGISSNTVRNHLKSIFRKLEVHSQQEAIDRFRQLPVASTSESTAATSGDPKRIDAGAPS
jgi:DNA-binding CsgD family transcriptional regulator